VVNRLCDEGILIATDSPHHAVLKLRAPMPFTIEDADVLTSTLALLLQPFGCSAGLSGPRLTRP